MTTDTSNATIARLVEDCRRSAKETADEGRDGWGNICADAADTLEQLARERDADRKDADEVKRIVRVVAGVKPRVETGAVQFGDDWPGVFIRGDNAAGLAMYLAAPEPYRELGIKQIMGLLSGCNLTLGPLTPEPAAQPASAQADGYLEMIASGDIPVPSAQAES